MTRRAEGSGSVTIQSTHEDQEDMELSLVGEVEYTTDYVPYGSTYAPMESAEFLECHWELDGEEIAEWALDHKLGLRGFTKQQIADYKKRAEENWKEDEGF